VQARKMLARRHTAALTGSKGPRQPTPRTLPTAPDGTGKRPQAPAHLPHRLPPIVCHPRPDRGSPASWHHPRTSVIPGLTGNLLPRGIIPAYPSCPTLCRHGRPDRPSPASWHTFGISSGSATNPSLKSRHSGLTAFTN